MSDLVHRLRPASGEPAGALVLLHGRGADEADLEPFVDLLDPQRRLVGLTPGAPLFLPPGGRHWYVVPRVGYPDHDTFHASLDALADQVPALTGVPWERTIVGGFSQGSVMSYALALGVGRPTPAGLIVMSGFVPQVGGFEPDVERPGLPVWVTHGRHDPVIPVTFARAARELLGPSPVELTYTEHDGAHHVDPRVLATLPAWVEEATFGGAAGLWSSPA